jgi:hypothetical protein
MGVEQPQDTKESNEDDLAEDLGAVEEEGKGPANNGGLDQVEYRHKTVFTFYAGIRRLCARLPDKAAVCASATTIIR